MATASLKIDSNATKPKALVNWDDKAVESFMYEFQCASERAYHACAEVIKDPTRIKFVTVHISKIDTIPKVKVYQSRVKYWKRMFAANKPIGTLFAAKKDGRWKLKDGHHRFEGLRASGVTQFRIGYDVKGKVFTPKEGH